MPAAIWTGSLSFGLVVIPVRLHPAIRKKTVRFHELDSRGRRLHRVRVAADEYPVPSRYEPAGWPDAVSAIRTPSEPSNPPAPIDRPVEVPFEEVRKGFEVAPGQFVTMSREEVRELAPERSRAIEVERFVDVGAVDPIYFDSRYYVSPAHDAAVAFELLKRAMADAHRMAIASFTMRRRHYFCAIRPFEGVMLLTTMVHQDEILPAGALFSQAVAEPSERELRMARLLVDSMSGPFEPELYVDEHRERLLSAIARRTPQAEPEAPAPSPARVVDLMAALEASVKAARAARSREEEEEEKPRRRARRKA